MTLLADSHVPPYYISNRRADGPYSSNYFVTANYKYIESIIKVQLPKFYTFKDNAAYSDFLEEFSHRYSFELSDMKGYGGRVSDIHEDSIPYRHYHKLDPILTYIKLERSEEDIAELIENGLTEQQARALPLELEVLPNSAGVRPIAVYSRRRADWHNLDRYHSNLILKDLAKIDAVISFIKTFLVSNIMNFFAIVNWITTLMNIILAISIETWMINFAVTLKIRI